MQLSDSSGLELITRCINCSQPACCVAKEMFEDLMIKLMHQEGHKKTAMENTLENRHCGMRVFREKSQKKKF